MDCGLLEMGEKGNVSLEFRLRIVEYEEEYEVRGVGVVVAIVKCK